MILINCSIREGKFGKNRKNQADKGLCNEYLIIGNSIKWLIITM